MDAPEQPWDGSPHAKHTNAYSLLPPLDTKIPDLDVSPLQRHGCDAALEKNGSQTLCRKIA